MISVSDHQTIAYYCSIPNAQSNLYWTSCIVGRSVLVLLHIPIRRWTGEVPKPYVGVFLQSKKASSDPCCLLVLSLTDFCRFQRCSLPFRLTGNGADLKSCVQISTPRRSVPLSVIRTSGIQCLVLQTTLYKRWWQLWRWSVWVLVLRNNWTSSRPVLRSFVDRVRIGQLLLSTTNGLAFRAAGGLLHSVLAEMIDKCCTWKRNLLLQRWFLARTATLWLCLSIRSLRYVSGVFPSAYRCAARVERLSVRHERPARFLQLACFGFHTYIHTYILYCNSLKLLNELSNN